MSAFKSIWTYLNDPDDAYTRLEALRDAAGFFAFLAILYLI